MQPRKCKPRKLWAGRAGQGRLEWLSRHGSGSLAIASHRIAAHHIINAFLQHNFNSLSWIRRQRRNIPSDGIIQYTTFTMVKIEIAGAASPIGSEIFALLAVLVISLAVILLLRHYLPLRTTPAYLTVPIFFAIGLPASIILLVPIDLASTARDQDVGSRGIWLPDRVLLVSWRVSYWLTFALTWYDRLAILLFSTSVLIDLQVYTTNSRRVCRRRIPRDQGEATLLPTLERSIPSICIRLWDSWNDLLLYNLGRITKHPERVGDGAGVLLGLDSCHLLNGTWISLRSSEAVQKCKCKWETEANTGQCTESS